MGEVQFLCPIDHWKCIYAYNHIHLDRGLFLFVWYNWAVTKMAAE